MDAAWSEATASASPESRAEGVRAVIAAADAAGSVAYGSFATGAETIAVANSKGIQRRPAPDHGPAPDRLDGPERRHRLCRGRVAVDVGRIDPAAVGREAAEKARATQNPVAVDAGDWPVVLEEYAVVDILDMLGYLGFSALAVQEERSFYEPGRGIGSDLVTMVDDPFDPDGLPMAFDYEGVAEATRVARRPGPVRRGRLRRPDRRARRSPLDRPRPAGPESLRPVPAEHGHVAPGRRRVTSSSAAWIAACS